MSGAENAMTTKNYETKMKESGSGGRDSLLFFRIVRDIFSMTVSIKQRPEAREGASSPDVQGRAV